MDQLQLQLPPSTLAPLQRSPPRLDTPAAPVETRAAQARSRRKSPCSAAEDSPLCMYIHSSIATRVTVWLTSMLWDLPRREFFALFISNEILQKQCVSVKSSSCWFLCIRTEGRRRARSSFKTPERVDVRAHSECNRPATTLRIHSTPARD